jgi:CRP/FNR family transcriptional regulator, anaerobic regulatory protein
MTEKETAFFKIRKAIEHFHPLEEHEWLAFAEKLGFKKFNKGEYLIEGGQVENYIYFLNSGSTRSYFLKEGREFTVDFLFEGDFSTAYLSFLTREPSFNFIEALENTETVVISYKFLNEFYSRYRSVERIGRLMAEFQYIKRVRKEKDLLSRTAEERYAELFQRNPALIQNISVKHLSSYLGIQPESLSRIRKLYRGN